MSLGAGALLVLVIGMMIGWFAGWIARTDDNRRYAAAFQRRVDAAELAARQAWAELERVEAERVQLPAMAGPTINVHLTAPALPAYRDYATAAAMALAHDPRVIEAGVGDG